MNVGATRVTAGRRKVFEAKVSDQKWRVLARLEREKNTLAYLESVSSQEKHHHYEGETAFADTSFCVATVYARKNWQGVVTPCGKSKATRLIVRPHLCWEFPESLICEGGGIPWHHEMFELHVRRHFNAYAGKRTRSGKTTYFVGVETIMTARDIRENAGAPIELWDRAVTSYLARESREEVAVPSSLTPLQTPLPIHDAATSRWTNGAAFQRRPLRGAAYRWQGGQPCG